MKKTLARSLLLLAIAPLAPVHSQSQGLHVVSVDDSRTPQVSAILELRLPSGELADALSAADVRALEADKIVAGELQPTGASEPLAWVFAVDTSGTMKTVLPELKKALVAFIDGLGAADRAAILSFNDDVSVVHGLTADRSALRQDVEAITTGGRSTQLYLAVVRAAEQLSEPGVPRRGLIVVISDGKDEGTAYTLDDAGGAAQKAGASVLGLGLTGGDPRFLLNLQRISEKTGGCFIRVEPGARWEEKTALLSRHARSRFTFSWTTTLPTDGQSHPVRLEVAHGGASATADVTVRTPLVLPPWWRTRTAAVAAGALVIAAAFVGFVAVRSRRHKAQIAALKSQVASERRQREDVESRIGDGLETVKGKLEALEKQPAAAPAQPASPAAAPKRKTMFVAGDSAPRVPASYRTACLEVLNGPLQGSRLPLPEGRTTLGRDETNRVVVMDEKASSQHAVIVAGSGEFWLEDVGSTNGTFVDEQRLTARRALRNGERIRVGGTVFLFRGEA